MSARPDIINGHGTSDLTSFIEELLRSHLDATSLNATPFQHVISLGPRCTNTSSVYKAQRKYAGPFDWMFSSPRIVLDCLRDGFTSYLDSTALFEVATVFDAIGLPPGSPPRHRKLVGHSRYSEMTEGVGRGVIFNHHNPLTEEGYRYISRCTQRFLLALELKERKLYSFINIDRKLWNEDAICRLFEELVQRDHGTFLMLALNCIKNCGDVARQVEPKVLQHRSSGQGKLLMFELHCVGENRGSYFQDPFDAQRVQALMVQPYTYKLCEDPLLDAVPVHLSQKVAIQVTQQAGSTAAVRRWTNNKVGGDMAQGHDGADQQSAIAELQSNAEVSRMSRWGRSRASAKGHASKHPNTSYDCKPRGLNSHIPLRRGLHMPALGFGTWQLNAGGECRQLVEVALQCGCRLVDTAAAYKNEEDVGAALRAMPRSEIFLVTKLLSRDHGSARVLPALRASLQRLKVEYVDLYLMHSPRGGFVLETWDAMLQARDAGLTRAVGVSNFGLEQLEGLKAAGRELPEVNQIECHPWLQQQACAAWCAKECIAVMAYSPLARGKFFGRTGLTNIAKKLACSEAEVAIRWHLMKGFVVIPKSSSLERITENMSALLAPPLEADVMLEIDKLDEGRQSCPASDAMTIDWDLVAEKSGSGKGKGKGKSKTTHK